LVLLGFNYLWIYMLEENHTIFTLKNGIRAIHEPTDNGEVSHFGITIKTGSRYEQDGEEGLAHFIEHTLFKGTTKRKAYHILSRLDSVGGELNAYTTKEEIVIYASFQNEYFERAIELMSDITFNSIFPEKEIEKEKDVIIDEILSYDDSPSDLIFDQFEELVFEGHPLGNNILGTAKTVKKLSRNNIISFIQRNYKSENIVLSSVGSIRMPLFKRVVTKYFQEVLFENKSSIIKPLSSYVPQKRVEKKDTYQTHCLIGNRSYGALSDKRRGMILLNNILGGPAMNNRLSLAVREKHGFTYNIESNYHPYSDTGVFSIYFGTEDKSVDKTRKLVMKELKRLRDKKLGSRQFHQAKLQLKGQIALAQENRCNLMLSIGKSLLLYDEVDSIQTVYDSIDQIKAEELLEIANEIGDESQLTTLIYQ